jgi:hypothetical protein
VRTGATRCSPVNPSPNRSHTWGRDYCSRGRPLLRPTCCGGGESDSPSLPHLRHWGDYLRSDYSFHQPVGSQQRLGGRLAYEHQETHVLDMRMVQLAEQRKHHVADHELDQPAIGGR